MIEQVLDRHQIGQAFHDFFRSLTTFATTIVAIEFQLLFLIEKLLPYKVKILLVHYFSKLAKVLLLNKFLKLESIRDKVSGNPSPC